MAAEAAAAAAGDQPPPTATKTGTVLVNGRPFTGGTIPFNRDVDVTKGTLTLTTTTGKLKVFGQSGVVANFMLVRGTDKGKPIVVLKLAGRQLLGLPEAQDEQRLGGRQRRRSRSARSGATARASSRRRAGSPRRPCAARTG